MSSCLRCLKPVSDPDDVCSSSHLPFWKQDYTARCMEICQYTSPPHHAMPQFDVLTKLLARVFDVPVVMVTIIEGDFTHVASGVGVHPDDPKLRREQSFCSWSLLPLRPEVLIVPDATKDSRFCKLPRVQGPPNIRFYAGAPLVTRSGLRFGSLCMLDFAPRTLDAAGANMLCNVAQMVVRDMEKRAGINLSRQAPRKSISVAGFVAEGVIIVDVCADWTVLFANDEWFASFPEIEMNKSFWDQYGIMGGTVAPETFYLNAIKRRRPFVAYVSVRNDLERCFTIAFRPADSQALPNMPAVDIHAPTIDDVTDLSGLYFGVVSPASNGISKSLLVRRDWPIPSLEVGALLGRGGFGAVYKGSYCGSMVAVKTLSTQDGVSAKQEAEIGLQCQHSNLVRTLKFVCVPNIDMVDTCIVMELCDGGTLQSHIDSGKFRTLGGRHADKRRIMTVLIDIASGLQYMHERKWVHMDLSANNVMLGSLGMARITDFGMTQVLTEDTVHSNVYGTVTHMPPELLSEGLLSTSVDIYSFGVIMWELWSSKRAWAGLRHAQVIAAKKTHSRLQCPTDMPSKYRSLCEKCLYAKPKSRPSAVDIVQLLQTL